MIAASIGKPLMPWQQHVADVALEVDPVTGRFAYREIVLTVPRRSGKSTLLLALLVHRMLAMGRPQIAAFTMQNALQARMRMRREWHTEILSRSPALSQVYSFTGQPGAEALMFDNGSRIEVTASTASSGHGATLDLAVVDEAFDQPDDRLEQAFRPAIRTQPDAQLWWVSTAGSMKDRWFRSKVEAARSLAGDDHGTAIFEWSAPADADASDPAVWWECMPALGYIRADGSGLSERDIAEDYRAMAATSENGFRRAYLNQWVEVTDSGVLPPEVWAVLGIGVRPMLRPSLSVEVALDRSRATIGAAWEVEGRPHLEIVEDHPGVAWVPGRVKELASKYSAKAVVLDSGTEASGLADVLESAGLSVIKVGSAERVAACGAFYDAATAAGVSHNGDPAITAALAAARWRDVGDGARVFSRRRSAGDIAALYAVVLALHGLSSKTGVGAGYFSMQDRKGAT